MEKEKETNTNQDERYQKETHCPSCGRFTGVYTRCPYCQALVEKRLSVRAFKVIALLTSTVGLVLLLFYAKNVQTPLVNISELGPLSNFAHVRVQGRVDKSFGIHKKWGSLYFIIAQGDEGNEEKTIKVSAYSKVAAAIEERNLVPVKGDIVSVEGQVRFSKNEPSLLINAPEHIYYIKRANEEPDIIKSVSPENLAHKHLNTFVKCTGSVLSTRSFDSGMIINLDNGKNGLPVWIDKKYLDWNFKLNPGDLIKVTGKVETFKDELEIKVLRKKAVEVVSRVEIENNKTETNSNSTPDKNTTKKDSPTVVPEFEEGAANQETNNNNSADTNTESSIEIQTLGDDS
jgi:DNA/RNA endonuclease YhcR with UshA esterase domain